MMTVVKIGEREIELKTAQQPEVWECVAGGTEHDYRPTYYVFLAREHCSLVCVWCGAVACGDPSQTDPCVEPYHHGMYGEKTWHRTALGVRWPVGHQRPDLTVRGDRP